MKFANELKNCLDSLKSKGISRKMIAAQADFAEVTLGKWANGSRKIKHESAKVLFEALARYATHAKDQIALFDLISAYKSEYPDRKVDELIEQLRLPGASLQSEPETSNLVPSFLIGAAVVLFVIIFNEQIGQGLHTIGDSIWQSGQLKPAPLAGWCFFILFVTFFAIGFQGDGAAIRAAWVRRAAWRGSYVATVTRALDLADRLFLSARRQVSLPKTAFFRSWSIELYEKCLLVAILYPLLLALAQWLWTGARLSIGTFDIWPQDPYLWRRAAITTMFLGSVPIAYLARKERRAVQKIVLCGIALTINIAAYVTCWVVYGGVDLGAGALNMATVAFIIGITFKIFDTAAVPIAAASIAGASVAFVFLTIVQIAETLSGLPGAGYEHTTVRIVHTILNHALNIILFCGIWFVLSRYFNRKVVETSPRYAVIVYIGLSSLTAVLMFVAATQRFWTDYYFLLGLIPLMNAMFDFLSAGLTRYTLRLGLQKFGLRTLLMSGIDLLLAVLLFVLLVLASFGVIHLLNVVSGGNALPLTTHTPSCRVEAVYFSSSQYLEAISGGEVMPELTCTAPIFEVLQSDPGQLTWLMLVFASTLLPTFLHLSLACFALGPALLGPAVRHKIALWSEQAASDGFARAAAATCFAGWITLTGVVIAVVIQEFVTLTLGLDGLLSQIWR